MPATPKRETIQITFKLEEQWFRSLSQEAEALGISPNIAAREHVIRGLKGDRTELAALRDEVAGLRTELAQLRDLLASVEAARAGEANEPSGELRELRLDLVTAVAAILAELRPHQSKDQIAAWIKKNLLRKAT
jgi:hypothetical protein